MKKVSGGHVVQSCGGKMAFSIFEIEKFKYQNPIGYDYAEGKIRNEGKVRIYYVICHKAL
ncbi:hypothetical protein ES705_42251 [subsurface metagenome]